MPNAKLVSKYTRMINDCISYWLYVPSVCSSFYYIFIQEKQAPLTNNFLENICLRMLQNSIHAITVERNAFFKLLPGYVNLEKIVFLNFLSMT